jgi:hypothetical protein
MNTACNYSKRFWQGPYIWIITLHVAVLVISDGFEGTSIVLIYLKSKYKYYFILYLLYVLLSMLYFWMYLWSRFPRKPSVRITLVLFITLVWKYISAIIAIYSPNDSHYYISAFLNLFPKRFTFIFFAQIAIWCQQFMDMNTVRHIFISVRVQ